MKRALTTATLHVCREPGATDIYGNVVQSPVVEVVEAGKLTDLTDEQFEDFAKLGAVVEPPTQPMGKRNRPDLAKDVKPPRLAEDADHHKGEDGPSNRAVRLG